MGGGYYKTKFKLVNSFRRREIVNNLHKQYLEVAVKTIDLKNIAFMVYALGISALRKNSIPSFLLWTFIDLRFFFNLVFF